jgi:uncharacterized protein YjbK
MHEEIKQKINFEEWLLQFRLVSKNTKNKIYRSVTLFVVLCMFETGLSH